MVSFGLHRFFYTTSRYSTWPWASKRDLAGLMGVSGRRVSQVVAGLEGSGLVSHTAAAGQHRLALADRGAGPAGPPGPDFHWHGAAALERRAAGPPSAPGLAQRLRLPQPPVAPQRPAHRRGALVHGGFCPASTIFAGWRQSVLPVHLLGLAPLLGSVGPVAGDVKLEDDGVVHDPVNRRGGGHGVGEDALPLREDQV